MNSLPYPGESSRMAEVVPVPYFTEAQKIMNRRHMEAMQRDLMKLNPCYDMAPPSASLNSHNPNSYKDDTGCLDLGGDKKNTDKDPWSTNQLRTDTSNRSIGPSPIFAYNSSMLSLRGESLLNQTTHIYNLPWSNISNDILDAWLPPHPHHTEAWYIDPVEVAAYRYEWRGFFEEASKLRMKFKALSLLHRWILQWYLWAEKQQASKDPPKGKTTATRINSWDQPRVKSPEWKTNISWKDPTYVKKSLCGKGPLPEILDSTLDERKASTPRANYDRKGKGSPGIGDIYDNVPVGVSANQYGMSPPNPTITDELPLQPCILDIERIIPQLLKGQIFHGHCLDDCSLEHPHAGETCTDSGSSIAYRNHARWVLEGNFMSDDSESDDSEGDGSMGSSAAARSVPTKSHRTSPGEYKGLFTHSGGCTSTGSPWNDLFFLESSESSEYFDGAFSTPLEDDEFPIISGEELEKILEEAKGTVQFHKWQNAPAYMQQKEFKDLVNIHRFAMESEAKNQERWKSRDKAKESGDTKTTIALNATSSSQPTDLGSSSYQTTPLSKSKTMKPILGIAPPGKRSHASSSHLKVRQQSTKESEYSYITTDDIKFLRELKRKLTLGEFTQQNQTKMSPPLSSKNIPNKDPRERPQGNISLHGFLLPDKPPPNISHHTDHDYGSWFTGNNEERASGGPEQPYKWYDGLEPKRHHMTAPSGDVSFHPGSTEYHQFLQAVKSTSFKRLVISTGRFWNPGANICLSGFWVTESLFITTLNFHPWAPSTAAQSLQDQIEDFELRNDRIDIFVSNSYLSWCSPNDDPEAIKIVLRAWDTSAKIAIFEPEDKRKVTKIFTGIDMLIEEDVAYGYSGAHISTVGYNPLDSAKSDQLGLRLPIPGHRSVTFGNITISEGHHKNTVQSPPVFARLDPGFSHGSYGRVCVVMEKSKDLGSIIGIVSGQCEGRGLHRPEALSDAISIFPNGFKAELRRLLKS